MDEIKKARKHLKGILQFWIERRHCLVLSLGDGFSSLRQFLEYMTEIISRDFFILLILKINNYGMTVAVTMLSVGTYHALNHR
ncbi:MAG: hypothetical protein E7B34_15775, partial [Hafnia alvei]|nr:hypothetical protein [Hafnia alvei]